MGLQIVKKSYGTDVVAFQKVFETAQGGFSLDASTLVAGNTLLAGTPIGYDESTRRAKVAKTAELTAAATNVATTYQVKKGHHFKVGDNVAFTKGGAAYAITAIDTSNANYDVLTVGTTLGVAKVAGDVLFQSSAAGAAAAAYSVDARGLLMNPTIIEESKDIDVVLRGTVYERRVPKATADQKAAMPAIIYSQSF